MKLNNAPHKLSFSELFQWGRRPTDLLDAYTQRYGDIFTIQLPGEKPITIISHPKALEDILTAPWGTFAAGVGNEMFRPVMGDNSLMLLDGKPHQRQRKLLVPPYHGERMRLYGSLICELTEQMMKSWKIGSSVEISTSMREVSLNALLNVVFGLTKSDRSEKLRQKLLLLVGVGTSAYFTFPLFFPALQKDWGSWSPWGRFLRLQKEVDELLYAEIAERRQHSQSERTDILSLLLAARDEEGQPMSDRELRDELITLLLVGYDTASTALMWAFYWIHKVPEVRQNLLAEIDTISDFSNVKAIAQLPYLTATCQETLRITPAIILAFMRVAQAPFQTMGYEFPVGSRIYPNIYSTHRHEEIYPNPQQFQPERFLNRQFSAYEYLPFGGGNRMCVGNAFAMYLMKLVIFTILSRYQLNLTDTRPVNFIRRGPGIEPSRSINLVVTARRYHQSNVVVNAGC